MPENENRLQLGRRGEEIAVSHLEKNGYKIQACNERIKQGEIDIVAEKDEYLVFVEVKSRKESIPKISPFISMTKAKCSRIRYLGKAYLERNEIRTKQPRFDVIGIIFQNDGKYSLEHVENAF
jgi:putative endonuclease